MRGNNLVASRWTTGRKPGDELHVRSDRLITSGRGGRSSGVKRTTAAWCPSLSLQGRYRPGQRRSPTPTVAPTRSTSTSEIGLGGLHSYFSLAIVSISRARFLHQPAARVPPQGNQSSPHSPRQQHQLQSVAICCLVLYHAPLPCRISNVGCDAGGADRSLLGRTPPL